MSSRAAAAVEAMLAERDGLIAELRVAGEPAARRLPLQLGAVDADLLTAGVDYDVPRRWAA